MASILLEGFDEYGPAGSTMVSPATYPSLSQSLAQGGWTVVLGSFSIVAGLSGQGYALSVPANAGITKTLPGNYGTIIGGFKISANLLGKTGMILTDNSTAQVTIYVEQTSGFIAVAQGNFGTILGASSAAIAGGVAHEIEFEIIFGVGSAGGYTVWLDGVQILNGTGTTRQSTNSYCNVVEFYSPSGSSGIFIVDDLYLFDTTTAFNNSVLLSNPEIITQWPIADASVVFTNEGNIVGNYYTAVPSNTVRFVGTANVLYLAPFVPSVNCTVNQLVIMTTALSTTANFKGVVYSDNSGVPNTLLTTGTQVTGIAATTPTTLPLVASQALTAGTTYWFGFITDTALNFPGCDGTTKGVEAANTYSSGAPATAPAMTANQTSIFLYGLCTGATTNWETQALLVPVGLGSSTASSTVNAQDTYIFPALPVTANVVYCVSVRANAALATSGSHTINLVTVSQTTQSSGSTAGQALSTSFDWYESRFDTDPHTTLSWTPTAVSLATHGPEVAS